MTGANKNHATSTSKSHKLRSGTQRTMVSHTNTSKHARQETSPYNHKQHHCNVKGWTHGGPTHQYLHTRKARHLQQPQATSQQGVGVNARWSQTSTRPRSTRRFEALDAGSNRNSPPASPDPTKGPSSQCVNGSPWEFVRARAVSVWMSPHQRARPCQGT